MQAFALTIINTRRVHDTCTSTTTYAASLRPDPLPQRPRERARTPVPLLPLSIIVAAATFPHHPLFPRLLPPHQQDMNTVEEIRALLKEMQEAVQSREATAAACIRGLTAEVGVAQAVVDALPAAQDASKAQKAALEGEKEERSEVLASLNKDIADARQNVECMEAESVDVEEKAKGVEHASSEQAPRVLHALSLYANITGIRWKYDDDENSHLIRGCT